MENCTFDMKAATGSVKLFDVLDQSGVNSVHVHTVILGGKILLNDASKVTVYNADDNDSLKLGTYGDAYPTITVQSGKAPTNAFVTDEGNGYFYASKTAGTYLLGIGRAKITGAAVNLGADLSVLYYVRIHDATLLSEGEFSMTFEVNGKTVTVTAYELVDGEYVFTLTGITPQRIADLIDATFTVNSEAIVSKNGYSVKQNCLNLLAKSAEQLGLSDEKYAAMQTLIADLLAYGQAAQDYKGYEGNGAILDGTENVVTSTVTPNEEDAMTLTGNVTEQLYFTSATVKFDNVNQLIVKLNASDADKTVVKINGTAYAPGDLVSLGNGIYKIETEGLAATDFDKAYEIELIYNGESVATLTYSVNAYAYAMNNGATENADMQTLALALYRYGVSAENYANAQ